MPGIPEITPYQMPPAGELPAGVDWSVTPDRAVLLVHDMQKFFLSPFPAGQQPVTDLVRNASLLRDRCAALGIPVAYTAQPGGMTPQQRGLLADFWGPGMTPSPEHREVVAPVRPVTGDWMLTKWRYSAFFRTDLLERMRKAGRDQLIICGVYAHVGILTTAIEAFTHDIWTFLVADAVADFSRAEHEMALRYAAGRCAAVTTAEDVLRALPVHVRPGTRADCCDEAEVLA
ncbi:MULTISPECIES: isochorismatase family protein [unclassified Streptomyces]|uniref:isochorismatase family protein n=1 Tax=unclassified Streptomyces TaxID=2593676 RepID=UPI000DAC53DC|nr:MULTISPECIES: isochorismatase family protein [unclassified Streptomyces]PZT74831.1 isochorismatase [Streptomyces sp. AC1-42T]PZT82184.1 isochorismatase [Streptomyces sp. AC1-42W]